MVCSCTAAERDILSDVLYVGQVLDGLVRSIHRFGAFVEVQAPSGQQGQVRGLLWKRGNGGSNVAALPVPGQGDPSHRYPEEEQSRGSCQALFPLLPLLNNK